MDLKLLTHLGLSDGQISVYTALLEIGETSIGKIQEKTGIERRNIYDILNKLIERGFVTYMLEKKVKVFKLAPPQKIQLEINQKMKELETLTSKIPEIAHLFNSTKSKITAEVFRGDNAIKSLFTEMLDYDTYWIGGNSGVEKYTKHLNLFFKQWMNKRVENKKIMYDLVDYGIQLEGLDPKHKSKHKKQLYKYCELPKDLSSPMVIVMYGNKVVQLIWSEQPFAFVLDSKEIHESYMKYFNYFWKEPW